MESNKKTQAAYLKAINKWLEKINEISNSNLFNTINTTIDKSFKNELTLFLQHNSNLSSDLTNYRSSLDNLIECDDLGCDLFFNDKQHDFKKQVKKHLKQYQDIIKRV